MRILTILLTALFSFPFALSAQTAEAWLQKVSAALSNGQDEQAATFFGQATDANPDKSEMYYWTEVDKNSDACPKFAQKLATYYKKARNYDKAYLFYKELLQKNPTDVTSLTGCAEMEVFRGKESEALQTYEKIIGLDANNLAANIFIGNYLYLKAEQEKRQLQNEYEKLATPTRMQYARYKDNLSRVLSTGYAKAKEYLQNVIRQFPSTEAQKTLNKIRLIEKEINR
ncbi:MAG: tetratricopeptide repeat protein [Bacteroides sp.]